MPPSIKYTPLHVINTQVQPFLCTHNPSMIRRPHGSPPRVHPHIKPRYNPSLCKSHYPVRAVRPQRRQKSPRSTRQTHCSRPRLTAQRPVPPPSAPQSPRHSPRISYHYLSLSLSSPLLYSSVPSSMLSRLLKSPLPARPPSSAMENSQRLAGGLNGTQFS